ncbi:hypothetical protein [Bradyrhizobium sp. USDA 4470]
MRAAIFRASFGHEIGLHAIEYVYHCLSLPGIKRRDLAICLAQRLIGRTGLTGCKHRKRLRPQWGDVLLE